MAAKLEATNVHQLKPRKARGAKSSGGKKGSSRLKPRAGESKPATARKSAQPSDADVRQNTQDRLIALHQQHRVVEANMSAASEVLSGLREKKAQIRASIQNTCIPLAIYDELHGKVTKKTKRADNELYERQRAMAFEAFGLPVGPQPELDFAKVPEAARPALHWESVGYSDGINGQASDPNAAGVPPENFQDYMRGFSSAMDRNGRGMKSLKDTPAPKAGAKATDQAAEPPLMVGEDPVVASVKEAQRHLAASKQPDWKGFPQDPDEWAVSQQEVFKGWFLALDPTAEVDIAHQGAAKMFDRLVAEEQAGGVHGEPPAAAPKDEVLPVIHAGPAHPGQVYMLNSEEPYESGRQATYKDGQPIDSAEAGSVPYYDTHPIQPKGDEPAFSED